MTRKYVSYFGTIFNDIHIERGVAGEDPSDYVKVPISYAPKKKVLTRYLADPGIDKPAAIVLPRMSFEIMSIDYDGTRNLPNLNKYIVKDDDNANNAKFIYVGAPYNITFNLYIYVKNTEDGLRIFEQILPFFKPEWTSNLQLIPEYGINLDIPVQMVSNVIEDQYDGAFLSRQILTYTYTFTMKAMYFGPSYTKPIIKFANTNFRVPAANVSAEDAVGNTNIIGSVRITPGLDANGEATSNASITVLPSEIWIDDDFGYITEVSGITLTE